MVRAGSFMRQGFTVGLIISGLMGFAALAADMTATIKERQALMKDMGAKMGIISGFIKESKGTPADVGVAAQVIANHAPKIPALFIEGSSLDKVKDPKTGAKPEIWTDWAKFEAAAKTLADEATKLNAVAKGGNKDEIAVQFGKVGAACSACHTPSGEDLILGARRISVCALFLPSVSQRLTLSDLLSPLAWSAEPDAKRGAYIFSAAGCQGCHTDSRNSGQIGAGGRALKTPFGIFYGPNITPDPDYGIGSWSSVDFHRALREGIRRDGSPYYPAFPYAAFTKMSDQDIDDLYAYLLTLPPVKQPSKPHELGFPWSIRTGIWVWRMLYFIPGPLSASPNRSNDYNRGRYLVEALGHCEECHTPRTSLGGLENNRAFSGSKVGPEGGKVPNITPHADGIADWSEADITTALEDGMRPDGDFIGGAMGEVIANSTSKLTPADRKAIAVYLKSLVPQPGP
ncbi:MAG: cytochrome c [Alphaproteobacteria bacterium]